MGERHDCCGWQQKQRQDRILSGSALGVRPDLSAGDAGSISSSHPAILLSSLHPDNYRAFDVGACPRSVPGTPQPRLTGCSTGNDAHA
jgi:hypothetical protein